ncbi:inositol-tetrakisphosphate 1-kinase isoform X5 [Grus americana]|uniref:inositol-tetrakisphosphate 1-kinase isoform X5 n=2 Tax=Grus americana TaxID=9117 RepID=UPI002407BF8E|nr:inositol-tetrakisphosphate 1-kinase isoform X5 [Grus americana]
MREARRNFCGSDSLTDWFDCFLLTANPSDLGEVWVPQSLAEVTWLDLTKPIEDQGPLDVIIHKLTDVILEADQNDSQSLELVHRFQEYIDAHPETIILDPLPAIRTLLDRSKSYELIRQIEAYMQDERICSPPFMELTSACGEDTLQLIEKNGLAFPFICKTRVAHGTNSHEMAIIFNQEGLKAVRPPCVIQSFINHNAVLYKVFVVGESYTVVKRPSLKNFSAGISDRESIFFNSHNVSKPESSSVLTALDKIEGVFERPNDDVIREISKALRQALGVSLFGIDIIINNQTGQHAVIDINAFPDSVPLKMLRGWKQQTVPLKISSCANSFPTKRHFVHKSNTTRNLKNMIKLL